MNTLFFRTLIFLCFIGVLSSCTKSVLPVFQEQQKLYYSNTWQEVEGYPLNVGRNDDLFFFNPNRGFVINSGGYLLLTEDGGKNWETKFTKKRTFFRCLTFRDSTTGFLGTLGPGDNSLRSVDSVSMYETFDSGESWTPTKFNGPYPKGLCGLQTVSKDVIVGCGRVRGPSFFIKSTDGGKTWNSYDYNHLAGSLIAPYFYDEQHGILVGGTTTDKLECQSLILETFDGGTSWDTMYISRQKGEYCWKVAFPSESSGFVSIQRNAKDGQVYVLQTKDGGKTWFENEYFDEYDYVQGIGFVNEQVGWMGGSSKWTMETRDGGETWRPTRDVGRGFNKFQFFGDSMGYGTGYGVYKMSALNTVPNGWVENYYDSAQLQSKHFFTNGLRNGAAVYFHKNGIIESRGNYNKNLRHGQWSFFNQSGEFQKKIKYKNGVAKLSPKVMKDYPGKYKIEGEVYRTITLKKGKLYSKHTNSDKTRLLIPISDVAFMYAHNRSLRLEFIRDENGKVVHHIMKRRNDETLAVRVD